MYKRVRNATALALAFLVFNLPVMAGGGGRMAATQAMTALSGEVSGPMAYAISLIAIVAGAFVWAFNHHEMTPGLKGIVAVLFAVGIAVGGTSVLGMVPGVAGALI